MAKKRREIDRTCETVRGLVHDRNYTEAYELIKDIEPEELDSVQDIKAMAEVCEKTSHISRMKEAYLHLYNFTNARKNLKEFIQVLIRLGEYTDADVYLKEFEKRDGATADDFELRYELMSAKGAGIDEKIKLLEDFKKEEYMEVWGKRLADLYGQAGRKEDQGRELADLHLWFGGARIIPDEEPHDAADQSVVEETSENLAAKLEDDSEIVKSISDHVAEEVTRIVESDMDATDVVRPSEPTLDEMLSATARMEIERLEVEPQKNTVELSLEEELAATGPVIESVGMPHTASGEVVENFSKPGGIEAKYLNGRGQAETVGEPVRTDDPTKAKRLEQMFAVDENYEEGPADISDRGIRYYSTADAVAKLRRRDFEPPHFVLAGGEEKMTLTMTKRITKELSRLGYTSATKVMRITAERMNSIRLEDQIDRLIGRCLLITEAAEMTKSSVDQLLRVMHEFGDEFVVVMSGPFDEIDCFLEIYPELSEQLGYKIRMVY
ncbi:MAG: hypothetical protein J6P16_06550 [Eubacterium sp.]|nr:hypothetical protein [Eubacterium sp.]